MKAIEHFLCVNIASSKQSGAGRILKSYANPLTTCMSRVCINVSNSSNPPCV